MSKPNRGFSVKYALMFLLLFLVLLIAGAGCDPNANEKERLTADMENIKIEIDNESVKWNGILSELNDLKNKISELENKKSLKEDEKTKCQYDLGEYVLDHKMITLSLIATGGGIVATLEENLDEDIKAILQGLGAIGAIYCILNPNECTEVTAKIAWYGTKLSYIDDEISAIDDRLYELKKKVGLIKEKSNEYEDSINALNTQLQEKQERYNSL